MRKQILLLILAVGISLTVFLFPIIPAKSAQPAALKPSILIERVNPRIHPIQFEQVEFKGRGELEMYPGVREYSFWNCTGEELPSGHSHHPVLQQFWCFQGKVSAGYEVSGWLGQVTPIHIHCWGERAVDQKKKIAVPTYGPCGFTQDVTRQFKTNEQGVASISFDRQTDLALMEEKLVRTSITGIVDNTYYEYVALLNAVLQARGSFVMIELGAGWGRWLMHAYHANRQAQRLPTVLIGVEADPLHFQFMRQNFATNGANPDEHILLFGGVSTMSGEDKVTRMNPASSYGAALVDDPRYGFTTVPTTSLRDLLSSFWIVDHVDFDIQGLEVDIINASREELNLKVRSIWVECHTVEVYFKIVDIIHDMQWKFVFNLPPAELDRKIDLGQGPVQLERAHGGVYALNPRIE